MIDCATTPANCLNSKGSTKTFDDEIEFYNVNVNSFANHGEMIFKNRVFFDADTSWGDFASLTNDGIMTFYNDVYFAELVNINNGTPQFNVLNFNANDGFVQGIIENIGIMNINGKTTFGNQIGNQLGAILHIKSPATFNDSVINWDGDTQIGGIIIVESPTTFNWALYNYNNATITIKSPTTVARYLNNSDNATLEIKGTTLTVKNTLWNFRNATLIFSALNGQLGQLIGDFINYAYKDDTSKDEGKVQIIVTGLTAGQQYQIVTGNATVDSKDISFVNGFGRYLGNGYVFIDEVFSLSAPIKVAYQSNISTMNAMFLQSNAVLSANKHKANLRKMANLTNPIYEKIIDSRNFIALDSLQSNESFFYNGDSLSNKATKSIRKNRIKSNDSQSFAEDLATDSRTNLNNDKYHFIFTPFINHTYFYESDNYAISGLEGGFITAFSAKVGESNTLGAHFAFGYGSLGDKNNADFKIASANLMVGLHYRLDLIYDMFLKARGDFYYFLNEVGSNNIAKTKPNNMGFGASLSYGKDFDFGKNGVLGLELGLDYKMLNTNNVGIKYALDNSTIEQYNKTFYNLLYLDFGINYYKYFSTAWGLWGFDSGIGIRGNLTPKISKGTLMIGNKSVDISLNNDNILAYANIGGSYVLQSTNFAMEFSLRYSGGFGDRAINNGGSFEWRVFW